ncbi:sensor histidine kinase [Bacteroidota bacterium]
MKKHNYQKIKHRKSKLSILRLFIIFLVLILFSCYSASAWQTEYKFEKGQVLEYEYTVEDSAKWNVFRLKTVNLNFEILDVTRNIAIIKLTIGSYKRYRISHNKETGKRIYNPQLLSGGIDYGHRDYGENLTFKMNLNGEILEINGIEKLISNICKKLEGIEVYTYKIRIPYPFVTNRYGKDFYRGIIQDVFPLRTSSDKILTYFSETSEKKVKIFYEKGSQFKPNIYSRHIIEPFELSSIIKEPSNIHQYNLHINENNGFVLSGQFKAINWISTCFDKFYENDSLNNNKVRLSKIVIKNVSSFKKQKGLAWINGNVLNGKGKTLLIVNPSASLPQEEIKTHLDSKSFNNIWEFDLVNGSTFIEFLFEDPSIPNNRSDKVFYKKFVLFIRPGDTINFSIDHNDFTSWHVDAPLQKENTFLNNLDNYYSYDLSVVKKNQYQSFYTYKYDRQNPTSDSLPDFRIDTIKTFVKDSSLILFFGDELNLDFDTIIKIQTEKRRLFNLQKEEFDREFIEKYEFESDYMERSLKVNKWYLHEWIDKDTDFPIFGRDSLLIYKPYLNNVMGIHSKAYRQFLNNFNISYSYIYWELDNKKSPGFDYDHVKKYFDNWDQYYLLSKGVSPFLNTLPQDYYFDLKQRNFNQFIADYPGTEIATYFQREITKTEEFYIGKQVPDFILDNLKSFLDGKLPNDPYAITISDGLRIGVSNFNTEKNVLDYIKIFVLMDKDSLKHKKGMINKYSPDLKELSLIGVGPTFISKCGPIIHKVLIVGKNNIILHCLNFTISSNNIINLLSWPQGESTESKTINLTTLWFSIVGVLGLSVILILVFRFRSKRREARQILKTKIAKLEMDAVRSRMNPHFLFNALSSIQNLINTNQVDKANTYLVKFAKLIRRVLEQSTQKRIELKEEIETLRYYLELESLRQKFKYDIKIDPELDTDLIEIPPLLLQPHVENALIHGIAGMKGKGEINIEFSKSENNLVALVKDNGIGIQDSQNKKESNGLGQGWKITRERIEILNKSYEGRIHAEILDKKDESGTFVKFTIPME